MQLFEFLGEIRSIAEPPPLGTRKNAPKERCRVVPVGVVAGSRHCRLCRVDAFGSNSIRVREGPSSECERQNAQIIPFMLGLHRVR